MKTRCFPPSLFLEALGKVLGSQLLQPCSRIPSSLAHTFGK